MGLFLTSSVLVYLVAMAEKNRLTGADDNFTEGGADENAVNASLNEDATGNVAESGGNSTNAVTSPEMKNVQDLTRYVELLLQQMQERFQTISDQVLSRNILC